MPQKILRLVQGAWIASMLSVPLTAFAYRRMVVPKDTDLFSRPAFISMSNHELKAGSHIVVANDPFHGFRHILIEKPGPRRLAYVLESDYQNWLHKRRIQKSNWSLWVGPIYSYVYESPRAVTTNLNSTYTISAFSGGSPFYALGLEHKISDQWWWRIGLVQRSMDLVGTVIEQSSGQSTNYRVTQNFIGAIGGFRYMPSGWNHLKLDLFAEFSKGENVKVTTIASAPIDNSAVQTSTFIMLSGGLDYEFHLTRKWSFIPAARFGIVASVNPIILTTEAETDFAYSL